ncbi:MAG: cell surface protein, partial [Tidjanibacter sp.]|nr:cell surface protein [Tidjanibacter sp.]
WGYADNEGSNTLASDAQNCGFDISNAVREDGEPMPLAYIDFVKVQCAINHTAGPLGEISTEIADINEVQR